jgi:aryl-alcohol dehydrogenase-like predicted oxidoreductase
MKQNILGSTGIKVSELCFGILPMGPMQTNISVEDGAQILCEGMNSGINFFDTAQMYRTYPHLAKAMKMYGKDIVINSKSVAESYEDMEKAIQEAMRELDRDYIDGFLLHGSRANPDIFEKRAGAWDCLQDYKEKGYVRAIGVAAHNVHIIEQAADMPELDIIFPIINIKGLGILGGSREDMLAAIEKGRLTNKGIYGMKALAGGSLLGILPEAINYVRNIPGIHSLALGMVNQKELEMNLRIFEGEELTEEELKGLKVDKYLHIMGWCTGCGSCAEACPNYAISVMENRAVVDTDKCVLCGYCTPSCPDFAIRMR